MLRKLKNYVSEADKFLKKYNREHQNQLSESQKNEIKKNSLIHKLRDSVQTSKEKEEIWEKF